MTASTHNDVVARCDAALDEAVGRLESSVFVTDLMAGRRVRALYEAYIREAYHFVRLTASFTPLAARRMDTRFLELRKWILHHSAEEMGHERMALHDLRILGYDEAKVAASEPLPGTWAWVHFFHYQVTERPPFAAMGVLYFLEGMAARLAPIVGGKLAEALEGEEKRATLFIREHGELDQEHTAEQRDMLREHCTDPADQAVVIETIRLAGHVKRFMLDSLVASIPEAAR